MRNLNGHITDKLLQSKLSLLTRFTDVYRANQHHCAGQTLGSTPSVSLKLKKLVFKTRAYSKTAKKRSLIHFTEKMSAAGRQMFLNIVATLL